MYTRVVIYLAWDQVLRINVETKSLLPAAPQVGKWPNEAVLEVLA